jgi:anhydro-N-acetylmuramic acid kinase
LADDYYIGLMSGTSMDGIDAALVRFGDHTVATVASASYDYPQQLRTQLYAASCDPHACGVDQLGELHTWTGECFRDASIALLERTDVPADRVRAIGSHGQTIRHQPGATHRFTLQIGNPAIIASGTGIDTVADFRVADMALGGQGAPLAPAFHDWLFRHESDDRVVLNIGGIANITVLPTGGKNATGFDTGPGNTLLDAWTRKHKDEPYDDAGHWAASGNVNDALLSHWLSDTYFSREGPKSTGFEYFNLARFDGPETDAIVPADVQATLAELTAISVADCIRRTANASSSVYVCGGGAHNDYLLARIAAHLPDVTLATTAAVGLDPDNVEAVAFAWLAMRRLEAQPGNLPSVTGASRPAILGAVHKA